jgi:hypothetical protein
MPRKIANPGMRSLCNRIGANLSDVERLSGVGRVIIYHWLQGRPSPEVERKLAYVFGLTVNQLRARVFPKLRPQPRVLLGGHKGQVFIDECSLTRSQP